MRQLASQARPDDAILNFSYDWLPLFASDFLPCPLGTLVSMGSLNRSLDQEIRRVASRHPERLAFLSAAQATSFDVPGPVRLIPPGLDLARYRFNARPSRDCCWLGRIVPEKGLDDVFAFAARAGRSVTVFGVMPDRFYWEGLTERYPGQPQARHHRWGRLVSRIIGLARGGDRRPQSGYPRHAGHCLLYTSC